MKLYFKVPPEADGMLLRGFLRRCSVSTDLSRAVKFRGSGFFADGAPILANRRVEAGQVISFELPPEGESVVPQDDIPVDVVYEDAFALVVEKPPHLAVHPTLNYPLDTLANGYAAWALRQGRSPVFRPVNRIDKDTSGLVLAAQNATPPRCWLSGWKALLRRCRRRTSPRAGRHRRPHRAAGGEHHRAVRHPRWQTQPDGIYHIESRKRPEPRGLRPGDGPDPPDTGTFCIHRPPTGRR